MRVFNEDASMATIRREITGRRPLAVTFGTASQITGLGLTTLWKYAKDNRIRLIRPPGIRRTLIDYSSLRELLSPQQADTPAPRDQRERRSRKLQASEARE
jgi:hypothetical protein